MSTKLPVPLETNRPRRRGLAPLELVLALPILLFIMALIINFGIIACWKVREISVARLAVWEARWPRTPPNPPTHPSYWPAAGSMTLSGPDTVSAMDDSRVDLPLVRGPLSGATINSDPVDSTKKLLDPTTGLYEGSADLTQKYPMLSKMGNYTIKAQTWLIDDKWQYQRMGMSSNVQRRIPVLYALTEASASQVNSYVQSAMQITQPALQSQLAPLDKDPDFAYYGSLFGGGGAPDFQPQFQPMCTTDRGQTQQSVNKLIDHIQGNNTKGQQVSSVAQVMTQSFLGLYRRALGAFQAILKQQQPPPPPQMAALAQSQIPQLQTKIDELQQFLKTIQAGRGK